MITAMFWEKRATQFSNLVLDFLKGIKNFQLNACIVLQNRDVPEGRPYDPSDRFLIQMCYEEQGDELITG